MIDYSNRGKNLKFGRRTLVAFLNFCLSFGLGAQPQFKEVPLKQLATRDGLSSFTVLSITQDRKGFMWFGTRDGLNRFDGQEVKIYKKHDRRPYHLGDNVIHSLFCNSDSLIWIGTNHGLYFYDYFHDNFHELVLPYDTLKFQERPAVRGLFQDDGPLWIGSNAGIFQYHVDTEEIVAIKFKGMDLSGRAFLRASSRALWVGTNTGLLEYANNDIRSIDLQEFDSPSEKITVNALMEDGLGRLWIANENPNVGLLIFDPSNHSVQELTAAKGHLLNNTVRTLFRNEKGTIWIGSRDGMTIVDEHTLEIFQVINDRNNPNSLSQNSIRCFFQDQHKMLWIGTYSGGVKMYDPRSDYISHFTGGYTNLLLENMHIIAAIFEDSNNELWIGTEGWGVTLYDGERSLERIFRQQSGQNGIPHDKVKDIAEDNSGRIFIGTNDGLSIYDPDSQIFYNIDSKGGEHGYLLSNTVHDLTLDDEGNIWIGTIGEHCVFQVYHTEEDTIYHYCSNNATFPSQSNLVINTQCFDRKNRMVWSGGDNGLTAFDMHRKTYFTDQSFRSAPEMLEGTMIYDLMVDDQNRLWIGTIGAGMYYMDLNTFQLTGLESKGVAQESFYAIVLDDHENIWASTNNDLIKIAMDNDQGKQVKSIDRYGVEEGFPIQQYYRKAAWKGNDGTLYFGGYNGFVAFDPVQVKNIVTHPGVVITDILIDGQPFKIPSHTQYQSENIMNATSMNLSYDQSSFSVHFVAPNYLNPDNIWYQYQLVNLDHEWQDIGNSKSINFSGLKPGDYELRIRASSDRGIFGNEHKSLLLIILPPFWQTTGAYVLYIGIILAALYTFFLITRKWERLSQKLKYEHLEREREKHFHQQRMRFFTDISHELRTPLTLILAPLEKIVASGFGSTRVKNQLMLMLRNGERMLQLINQLLDLRKLETGHVPIKAAKGNIVHFVKEVSLSFRELSQSRQIEFSVQAEKEEINVWFDRNQFEIILYNLLSNAIKFTPDRGKIQLYVDIMNYYEGGNLADHEKSMEVVRIRVKNSGKGIPEGQLGQIFERFFTGTKNGENGKYSSGVGLEIVKKLVKLHKGEILVESKYDEEGMQGYALFTIVLKKGKKHFTKKELLKNYKSSEDITAYKRPLESLVSRETTEESTSSGESNGKMQKEETILVVEDNLEVRRLVVDIFREKYDVREAVDGEEGLKISQEVIPDLIISDIMMPKMDGIELCREVKSNINTSHVPVILLTARTAVTFKYEGLETGADDYIVKPFNVQELWLRATNLIRQRKRLREVFADTSFFIPGDMTITSVDEKILTRTIEYILEHIEDTGLTVQKISKEIGMSRVNFYRKIKALTNMSAAEFLRKVRMERAAELLKTNKLNVSEVRYKVGISDADYFRKCFKERFGMTPKDYQDQFS